MIYVASLVARIRASANQTQASGAQCERTAQLAGGADTVDAIARLKAAIAAIPNVVQRPAPEVNVPDINLVGPAISVRPYCYTDHDWQVYFDTNAAILRVAKDAGWPAPTPSQINRLIQVS